MLELNGANAAPQENLISDVTEATFLADVVEMSQTVPVIVDFWAPWCGPCKTLGPALEKAVLEARGKVRMAKIDVDKNQRIAAELRVQSIPTVYAFWQGQPVDGFQGAVQTSEVRAFVERIAALAGDGGLGEALVAAEEALEQGQADDAAQIFAAILEEDPKSTAAYGGLIRAHIALDELDTAEAILNGVPAELSHAADIEAAHAQLELKKQAANAGPIPELEAQVAADPANHQARFDLATALLATGKVQEAVDQLLELFRRDRDWNDSAAKQQLMTIFDALTPKDPIALSGRRRLSSLIFA